MPELRNSYLVHLGGGEPAIPWDPRDSSDPPRLDCVYFGRAFLAMEERLGRGGLTVVLSWEVDALPAYGPDVVAVVLGDEASRRPPYVDRVGCVFKCYGARPHVGDELLRAPSRLAFLVLLEDLRRLARAGGRRDDRVHDIPLGYYNQLDLPLKPFDERATSVFFAGSVDTAGSRGSLERLLPTPRVLSRSQMLAALATFEARRPEHRTLVHVTPGFASVTRDGARAYSEGLMDARICLAPRGGSRETFRFFEALRYGCVVVSEPLPPRWFYSGAPVVTVRRWHRLPEVLESLLDDPAGLRERHAATLAWWRERCSEEAVGAFMAERLDGAGGY